jgi:hypothetical protein
VKLEGSQLEENAVQRGEECDLRNRADVELCLVVFVVVVLIVVFPVAVIS